MSELTLVNLMGYRMAFKPSFAMKEPLALLQIVRQHASGIPGVLGGRANVIYAQIPALGRVVVKRYRRGGVLGRINRHLYVRCGRLRSEIEFSTLDRVRAIGVNAPEPICFITYGGFLYSTWLVTREVEEKETLAQLALRDEDAVHEVVIDLARQVNLLIAKGIFHVDLHPGNVLVHGGKSVFLVDFDKACDFKGAPSDLRERYIIRWRRAVIKHRLPEALSELFCLELKKRAAEV